MQYFLFCELLLYLANSLFLYIQIVSNLLLLPTSQYSDEKSIPQPHVTHTSLPATLLSEKYARHRRVWCDSIYKIF